MRNNEGKAFVNLLIIVVILAIICYIAYNWAVSKDGIITKVTTDEEKYNKSEVLEEINFIITQKYLEVYKKATAGGENKIEQFYNGDKVIAYLKGYTCDDNGNINLEEAPTETAYIEDLASEENCYYVNIKNFKRDITTYGIGENAENSSDYFFIRKEDDKYNLYYQNANKEIDEVGTLSIEQSM